MKRLLQAISITAFLFGLHTTGAVAQSDCDAVLIPTQIDQSLNWEQELALARLIDSESEYGRAVKAGASGSYRLFKAGSSYEDFKRERERVIQQQSFQASESQAQRLVTSFLPPELAADWVRCRIASSGGVVVHAKDITPEAVSVVISWYPVRGGSPTAKLQTFEVRGARNKEGEIRDRLSEQWGSEDRAFILDRESGKDLRLVIGIGGHQDSLYVPAPRDPPPACPALNASRYPQKMIFVTKSGTAVTDLPSNATVCGVAGNAEQYRNHGLPSNVNVRTVVAGQRVTEMMRGNCAAAAFWEARSGGNILGLDREFRNMRGARISTCDIAISARD